MDNPLRRPEQILAYRPLKQILAAKPKALWAVAPRDSALSAMRLMDDKHIGFVVVMDNREIVGVVSERDCTRKLLLVGKSPEATPVADIMVRDVVKADVGKTFADCLKLMHDHHIRHLPITENGVAIGVISVRDLLSEAVTHHANVIGELERERLTMLTSTA
jgi:CBS domain-containing protein